MTFRPAQILIELTIALAVAMIAILALIQSATKSVSNSTYSQNQSQATNNITQAVEWLRNEKNTSWPDFITHASGLKYCLNTLDWNTPNPCADETGRNLDISVNGDQVTATVSIGNSNQSIIFSRY
ncbi:MAG: hypothetical protein AAB550_03345 [Patescibacteria group bacterium]